MGQGAAQIFPQPCANIAGKRAGCFQAPGEVCGIAGQAEGFQCGRVAGGVFADQDEIAGVGHQHETVAAPVAADLLALRSQPRIIMRGFDFDDAAFGDLSFLRLALLHLLGRIQAKVGMARALVGQFADADDFGLER